MSASNSKDTPSCGPGTVRIHFLLPTGEQRTAIGSVGESLLDCALEHHIPGLLGQCGGVIICATCHCQLSATWRQTLPAPHPDETELLGYVENATPDSRLSCQVHLHSEHDGMTVMVPAPEAR